MKNLKGILCTAMLVLAISAPVLAKGGIIPTTKSGTIPTTKSGTIPTTRTGTIPTTRTGVIPTTITGLNSRIDRFSMIELLWSVIGTW